MQPLQCNPSAGASSAGAVSAIITQERRLRQQQYRSLCRVLTDPRQWALPKLAPWLRLIPPEMAPFLAAPNKLSLWTRLLAAMRNTSATRFLNFGRFCFTGLPPLVAWKGDSFSQETRWFSVFHLLISVPGSETKVAMVITSTPSMHLRLTPQIRVNSASRSNFGWFRWLFFPLFFPLFFCFFSDFSAAGAFSLCSPVPASDFTTSAGAWSGNAARYFCN